MSKLVAYQKSKDSIFINWHRIQKASCVDNFVLMVNGRSGYTVLDALKLIF
ncbi:MAG: hypothetical protein WB779_00410 [Ignavibacteriaceae bacterium]